MKLSMHIVKRWFEVYGPVANIVSGENEIEGVRIFSPVSEPDSRFAYIGRMKDFFPTSNVNEILLVHKNDIIRLMTENMEEVFNELIGAFDYYREWEFKFLLAAQSDQGLQIVADYCSELFGPTFMINQALHVEAISSKYQSGEICFFWDELELEGAPPLDVTFSFMNGPFMEYVDQKVTNYVFQEPSTAPYCYGIMNTYCNSEGGVAGQCIVTFSSEIETADLQLMQMVIQALKVLGRRIVPEIGNQLSEIILDRALRQTLDIDDLEKIYRLQGWPEQTWFGFAVVRFSSDLPGGRSMRAAIRKKCYEYIAGAIALLQGRELLLCIPVSKEDCSDWKPLMKRILRFMPSGDGFQIGISNCFFDFQEVAYYYRQARESIGERNSSGFVSFFFDQACDLLLQAYQAEYQMRCVHPALFFLWEFDQVYHTEYANTLEVFLRCERSYAAAGTEMHVHRNTILYRMEKIQELYPLRLHSSEEREYLLMSFRIVRLKNAGDRP